MGRAQKYLSQAETIARYEKLMDEFAEFQRAQEGGNAVLNGAVVRLREDAEVQRKGLCELILDARDHAASLDRRQTTMRDLMIRALCAPKWLERRRARKALRRHLQ